MSRDDNFDDMHDDRLSALYRSHMTSDAPSSASDAQVLRMAREAMAPVREVLSPAPEVLSTKRAPVTGSGWRTWLSAPWFGPGLAFATVASLSVVVIALMPKEKLAVEKEVASSPAASSTAATSSIASAPATVPGSQRDAPAVAADVANDAAPAPMASRSPSTSSNAAASSSASSSSSSSSSPSSPSSSPSSPSSLPSPRSTAARAKAATNDARITTSEANVAPRLATSATSGGRVAPAEPTPAEPSPAGPAEPLRRGVAPERNPLAATPAFAPFVPSVSQVPAAPVVANSASSLRADAAQAARRERQQPNAFPAPSQLATAPASAPSPAGAIAPPPPPSATAFADGTRPEKQSLQGETTEWRIPAPIAEVPDSAPTYPNESRPSIPLPYSYTMPRKSRDANATGGSPRTLEKAERASPSAPTLAAATVHRDPAEWVKAILKLKSEGKTEQVTKELADFHKQYPQYVLPEELRQIK